MAASSSGTVASLLSQLDQAIAEHTCIAQETKSTFSEASASTPLRLQEELERQAQLHGNDVVDRIRIGRVTGGIPLQGWVPASIRRVVGQSPQDISVQTLVQEAIQHPTDLYNINELAEAVSRTSLSLLLRSSECRRRKLRFYKSSQ